MDRPTGAAGAAAAVAAPPPAPRRVIRALHHLGPDARYGHIILPAALFLLVAGYTAWLWRGEVRHQREDIDEVTQLVAPVAAERFERLILGELSPLSRVLRQLGSRSVSTPAEFIRTVDFVRADIPSLKTVAWLDAHGVVRAVTPENSSELKLGQSVRALPMWGEAYRRAMNGHRRNVVLAGRWSHQPAQWACLPYLGPERDGWRARGAVVVRLELGERLSASFARPPWTHFHSRVDDDQGTVVYQSGNAEAAAATADRAAGDDHTVSRAMQIFADKWTVSVRPTAQFVAQRHPLRPMGVLIGGLGIGALISGGVFQALLHRRRTRERTDANIAALEALSKVSEAISDQPGASLDVLVQLARAAARLMNMSSSSITLYDPLESSMRVVHRDSLPNPDGRDVYDLSELPCSAECMRSGQPMLFGDVAAPESPFKAGHMDRFGLRALLILPLMASGNPMGVLLLADSRPRRFSTLDRRLVELWMAEARAILSNRKLYEGLNAALRSLQQILQQRETLYTVHTRISSAATSREVLDLLAELAPEALEVEACLVCLALPNAQTFEVMAVTPGLPEMASRQHLRFECPTCLSVLRSGKVQVIDETAPCPVHGLPSLGPMLFVPLRSRDRIIGLLALLGRGRSGDFHSDQIRTAELFAARVATAIENTQLYEQTRRQAESNAVLLRELNHRVGNNFASIIGLLKVAATELPPDSRQALDRAAHRVQMMARAHELFSGGVRSVRLGDLVHTTLASLSATDNPHVRFSIHLQDAEVPLFSSRAITLAIVLHELAYNALEHALRAGGELLVRSRAVPGTQGRLLIEIIDRATAVALAVPSDLQQGLYNHTRETEGNGHGSTRDTGIGHTGDGHTGIGHAGIGHTGIGLQLVRNLVARELRGSFSLIRAHHGTIATVEFPLEQENECPP